MIVSALTSLLSGGSSVAASGLPRAASTTTTTVAPCSINSAGSAVSSVCTQSGSLHISVAYRSILPILVVSIGALVMLALSAVLPKRSRPGLYPGLSVLTGLVSLGTAIWEWSDLGTKSHVHATIGGEIFYDRFSVLFMILVSVAVILSSITSDSYLRREGLDGVEAYVLMLMSAAGAMLMGASGGLIMLFLGLEIMSIALYVMAAYHRRRTESGEAGLKYFILGSFSSALFLYGIALVYGATGSTQFSNIANFLASNTLANNGILLGGMALIIVGLGFKVAAVPFHFWTPDVYQGSPTPFTGYMAAVAKAAGFAGLLRVLDQALITQQSNWRPIIWIMAVLSLVVGSLLAIAQKDLKRMLAYSSISQAGYVLVGLQAANTLGTEGTLFYLFTYTFIIIGSFAVLGVIQGKGEARNDMGAIRGLAQRKPWLAASMLVFLLAQAGVPFTSGFLAKFYVVQAAVERGQYPLAIIAMLAAAIAAFFYLRVALLMYSSPRPEGVPVTVGGGGSTPVDSQPSFAGLEPVPSLDGAIATLTLEDPDDGQIYVPYGVAAVLAICVVATIAGGVSSVFVDFAHQATSLL